MKNRPSLPFVISAVLVFTAAVSASYAAPSGAPAADFFGNSWDKTSAADPFKADCSITEGPVKVTAELTDEQKKNIDLFKEAVKKFRYKQSTALSKNESKVTSSEEKTTVIGIIGEVGLGNITHEEALKKIKALKEKSFFSFILSSPDLGYYSSAKGKWKSFANKEFVDAVIGSFKETPFTSGFDKPSFVFTKWTGSGASRLAQYDGLATVDAAKATVINALSEEFAIESQAAANIFIEEKTGLWKKVEVNPLVQTTLINLPVKKACSITYKNIKINAPKGAQTGSFDEFAGNL